MTGTITERAEALFASSLQSSQEPTAEEIRGAVAEMLDRLGARGCAECLAQEYGDHPEQAADRMVWALAEMRVAFGEEQVPRVRIPRHRRPSVADRNPPAGTPSSA